MPADVPWWEIEDAGGWPSFWMPRPPIPGAHPHPKDRQWPAEWRQRPHP